MVIRVSLESTTQMGNERRSENLRIKFRSIHMYIQFPHAIVHAGIRQYAMRDNTSRNMIQEERILHTRLSVPTHMSQFLGVVVVRNVFPGLIWSHWSHLQPMAADQNNRSKCLQIP